MRAALLLPFLTPFALPAQATWVVDALNRPGADFTDVQPAVDAAASGDRIEIRAIGVPPPLGAYYTAPVVDGKGLTIVGEGADGPSTTWWNTDFVVRNLPAGQMVHVMDISFGLLNWSSGTLASHGNQGVVLLERVTENAGFTPLHGVIDSRLVIVKSCNIRRGFGGWLLQRSSVLSLDSGWRNYFAGPVLDIQDSRVWLINSSVVGLDVNHLGNSGSALRTRNSEVWVGPGTLLQGGISAAGPREAVDDVNTSLVHFDPRSTVIGSVGSLRVNEPVPAIRTSIQGSALTIDHRCTPSSVALLAFGPLLPRPSLSATGLLCVDPLLAIGFVAVVPTSGDLLWQFAIPSGLPPELFVGLQGIELRADGGLQLTNLTTFGGV
ncbi:MAG: hypothetical protein AB7O97_04475 [Planctomycetota bacterium]